MWHEVCKGVLIAICTLQAVLESLYYIHMLQLNSYRLERYVSWAQTHDDRVLPRTRLLTVVPLALMLMFDVGHGVNGLVLYGIAIVLSLISTIFERPRKAKKPLVYTPRVCRLLVTQAVLLVLCAVLAWFLPARLTAAALMLTVLLTVALIALAALINQPMEKHIANGFVKDAKHILSQMPNLTVIGITGSYGKTSTKNFLYTLLSSQYNVLMTPESYNTPMGVVRTVRERLRPSHEIFICEMGAKNKGDIQEICDIVHPRYGMVTAIGEQHLETFKTVQTIVDTKFELIDALPSDGATFLNTDNEWIAARTVDHVRTVSYGVTGGAMYTASDITVDESGSHFIMTAPNGEICAYTTRLLGAHNIQNLAGCIAVAHQLGLSLSQMKQAVRQMKPVPHRLQLLPNGYIDDAYNSNPAGFRSALDVLGGMENTRRVLVTPGMVELGERQAALNEELGAYAASRCDYAVLVGERQAPPLKKGLLSAGFDEEHIFVAFDLHQGLCYVQSLPPVEQQIVLLENDLPDNF